MTFDACSPMEGLFQSMNSLSVRQPFASLIISGVKWFEVRSKPTKIRGRVLICSSAKPFSGTMIHPQSRKIVGVQQYLSGTQLLFGHAIGLIDIVGCRAMKRSDVDGSLLEFKENHFVWELKNPVSIEPFPVNGNLGFFKIAAQNINIKRTLG